MSKTFLGTRREKSVVATVADVLWDWIEARRQKKRTHKNVSRLCQFTFVRFARVRVCFRYTVQYVLILSGKVRHTHIQSEGR